MITNTELFVRGLCLVLAFSLFLSGREDQSFGKWFLSRLIGFALAGYGIAGIDFLTHLIPFHTTT